MGEPMKGEGALMPVYDGINEEPKEVNQVVEPESEFWNPFYDLLSLVFAPAPTQLPKANNKMRMARSSRSTRRKRVPKPHRSNFDNSGEYLDAHNNHLFGSQESAEDLVNPNSEEDKAARNPMKDHIRDTLLYNKVMPDRDAFDDYDSYITSFNNHLMSPVKKANKKPRSIWGSWFKF